MQHTFMMQKATFSVEIMVDGGPEDLESALRVQFKESMKQSLSEA